MDAIIMHTTLIIKPVRNQARPAEVVVVVGAVSKRKIIEVPAAAETKNGTKAAKHKKAYLPPRRPRQG